MAKRGAVAEVHKDDSSIATGRHDGADGASVLRLMGFNFKSLDMNGRLIKNITDASSGVISDVTEDTVTVTLTGGTRNNWNRDDLFRIFLTAAENTYISTIYTDKRFGQKALNPLDLVRGLFRADLDEKELESQRYRRQYITDDSLDRITSIEGIELTTDESR